MLPNFTIGRALEAAAQGARQLLSGQYLDLYWPVSQPGDAYSVAAANLIAPRVPRRRRRSVSPTACAACRPPTRCTASPSSAFPLFFPAKYVPLLSFPRFALAAFPVFVALALFTRDRPRAHAAIVAAMLVALAALTARFALFEWVA